MSSTKSLPCGASIARLACWGAAVLACSGATAAPAATAADLAAYGVVPQVLGAVELQTLSSALESPANATARTDRFDPSIKPFASDSVRARYWVGVGRSPVDIGAGADWAVSPNGMPLRAVVGLRADVSQGARVVYEVGTAAAVPLAPFSSNGPEQSATTAEMRLALEFKAADSAVKQLRGSLLRVQLSGTSALHFRPRGGGMVVSYRAKF